MTDGLERERRRALPFAVAHNAPDPTLADEFSGAREGEAGGMWLGGRDSNPDYTVQSRVSYH